MEKQENLQIPDQNSIEKAARKKTLEERAAEYGGKLNLEGELDWRGIPVGNEII